MAEATSEISSPERIRRRCLVAGRVQGVGFRESCRRAAVASQVTGWVRNLTDGRLEVVFEGPPGPVDELVAWCHTGPTGALVTDVVVVEEEPCEGDADFVIVA